MRPVLAPLLLLLVLINPPVIAAPARESPMLDGVVIGVVDGDTASLPG
jgi:hypothetical protein